MISWLARPAAAALALLISGAGSSARAVPVYLAPDSLFPSGHYNRDWLKGRTSARAHQRWHKVRATSGATGWVPEELVLSKLLLSAYARTQAIVELRLETRTDSRRIATLSAGTRVRLLGRNGRWFEAQVEGTAVTGFLTADQVRPDLDGPMLAYAKERTEVRSGPQIRFETFADVYTGERIEIVRYAPEADWVIAKKRNRTGWVKRAHLILRDDVPTNAVLALRSALPLRKQSVPFAEPTGKAAYLETLALLDSRLEEWGRVVLKDDGEVWWPMNEKLLEPGEAVPRPLRLTTSELFRRKIFDMASHQGPASVSLRQGPASASLRQGPASASRHQGPNTLQIAAADGIFRTDDGKTWQRVDFFGDQNHPLAVTPTGRVFVGPFVSDDGGQRFREYIRWDNLVQTIRARWQPNEHKVRILEVKAAGSRGGDVELTLDIGLKNKIRVLSDDDGQTWRTL